MHASPWWLALGALVAGANIATAAPAGPQRPFPQHVSYVAGTILPKHRTRVELDADVVAAWTRWKAQYIASAGVELDGRPRFRVQVIFNGVDRSIAEGQGYGMLLAAFLAGADADARMIFDGLFEFSADHPSLVDPRLFDFEIPPDEAPNPDPTRDASTFDGDADIAYALLLADRQWGSNAGAIDYRARALDVLAGILDSEIGPASRLPMLGDWFTTSEPLYSEWTPRTSDFMSGHFRVFAAVTGDPAWTGVRDAVLAATSSLQENFAPTTGLLPDFAEPNSAIDPTLHPARPNFLESPNDGAYFFNAGRVPWRLGVDALLSGNESAWNSALMIAFWANAAHQGNPNLLHEGYDLLGLPLDAASGFNSLFAAPIGVAAMLASELQPWLEALYDSVRDTNQGYYEDSVTLLSMLVMTGNWWEPLPVPEPSALVQGVVVLVAFASLRGLRCWSVGALGCLRSAPWSPVR